MTSILTGDIIDSRKLKNQEEWLAPLKKLFSEAGSHPEIWEIFRGDSFQIEIKDPEEALLMAIRIKATVKSVKKLDVRLAAGIGRKEFQGARITESNGEAFIYSGEKYESLRKEGQSLGIKTPWDNFDREMNLIIRLALIGMDGWSVGAAEVVKIWLGNRGLNQQEISKVMGLSQSSVSERLKRAHLSEVLEMEAWYRERIKLWLQPATDL